MTKAFISLIFFSFFTSFSASSSTTISSSRTNVKVCHQILFEDVLGPAADSTQHKKVKKDKYKGHVHTRAARFWGTLGLLCASVFSLMLLMTTFVFGGFWIFVFVSPIIVGLSIFLMAKLNRKKDKDFSRKKNWIIAGSVAAFFMLLGIVLFSLNIF